MKTFQNFMNDESGATAIEYGMIVALIAVAIIASVQTIGSKLSGAYNTVASQLP